MRIPRVFVAQPLASGMKVTLDAKTSHYLQNVLRLREEAAIVLFNGKGGEYPAVLKTCGKRESLVQLGNSVAGDRESPLRIHLGLGLSRGERMDMAVQKATELGVSQISPLVTERCEVRLDEQRMRKRREHWYKIITSACEQCGRNRIPQIALPARLDSFVAGAEADLKLLMHPTETASPLPESGVRSIVVLVGPEGGFSGREVTLCAGLGFVPFRLGKRILRTETAPLAALSVLQYRWGDFS